MLNNEKRRQITPLQCTAPCAAALDNVKTQVSSSILAPAAPASARNPPSLPRRPPPPPPPPVPPSLPPLPPLPPLRPQPLPLLSVAVASFAFALFCLDRILSQPPLLSTAEPFALWICHDLEHDMIIIQDTFEAVNGWKTEVSAWENGLLNERITECTPVPHGVNRTL